MQPENDMRAIIHMIKNSLKRSEKPAQNEMALILEKASVEWFNRIQELEEENQRLRGNHG